VLVFRQGDVGTNWYAVLSGSLDMNVSETGDSKVSQFASLIHLIDDMDLYANYKNAWYQNSPAVNLYRVVQET